MSAPSIDTIAAGVARTFRVPLDAIYQPRRGMVRLARARQSVMWLASRLTSHTQAEIGAALGGRDRTTVRHGVLAVEAALRTDQRLSDRLDGLLSGLGAASAGAAGAADATGAAGAAAPDLPTILTLDEARRLSAALGSPAHGETP